MDDVEIGGLRIAYRREGSGPPLMLLHGGFGFDHRAWQPQFAAFSLAYSVVAWDAPGAGGSADPPPTFRMPDYADCLASFMARLGLDGAHVLGLSFGGALALELYRRHPGRVKTLLLAGAYAGWSGSLPKDEVERRVKRLRQDLEQPPSRWIPTYLPGLLTEHAPQTMLDEVAALMSGVHPAGNEAMLLALAEADLRDVLPSIAVPTLLLYGDHDTRSPLPVAYALRDAIPRATLAVLPGAGHLSNIEAADSFNREVEAFLSHHQERSEGQ